MILDVTIRGSLEANYAPVDTGVIQFLEHSCDMLNAITGYDWAITQEVAVVKAEHATKPDEILAELKAALKRVYPDSDPEQEFVTHVGVRDDIMEILLHVPYKPEPKED